MGLEDDMFQDYDMHPEDMDFKVMQINNKTFDAEGDRLHHSVQMEKARL